MAEQANDWSDRLAGRTDWLAEQPPQILYVSEDQTVEELETQLADTKPWTSHHGSPGGERRRERKRSMIFLLKTREGPSLTRSTLKPALFQNNIGDNSDGGDRALKGFVERENITRNEL